METVNVPIQEAVNIIQGDIADINEELGDAGRIVGKIALWTGIGVGLGGVALYCVYQINKRLKELEANNNQKAGQ